MNPFRTLTAAALMTALACAGTATAATPHAGTYRGVTSQKDTGLGASPVALDVRRLRAGRARVSSADLSFTLACEDGSSISRSARLGGAKIARGGRFTISHSSGGNYGPDGVIRLTVTMRGRFTSARRAEGTFVAAATIADSPITPAIACNSGRVGWDSGTGV